MHQTDIKTKGDKGLYTHIIKNRQYGTEGPQKSTAKTSVVNSRVAEDEVLTDKRENKNTTKTVYVLSCCYWCPRPDSNRHGISSLGF